MQTKDSKPRKKVLSNSFGYVHARYLADVLCNAETPADLRQAASFGFKELCTLTGIEMPKPEHTPKAWEAVKQAYIESHRVIDGLIKQRGYKIAVLRWIIGELEEDELYSITGLIFQTAKQLSELLHHLWCKDNSEGYAENPDPPGSYNNYGVKRAPWYVLKQLKELQHTRHLIEEFGPARVLEGVEKRRELRSQMLNEVERQIIRRDLRDFITGQYFHIVLQTGVSRKGGDDDRTTHRPTGPRAKGH